MKLDDVETDLDQCLDCGCSLEIATVKFGFFNRTAMLLVCPGCGLARADSPKRVSIREWVAALRRKNSIAASRGLIRGDPIPVRSAGGRILRDTSAAPTTKR